MISGQVARAPVLETPTTGNRYVSVITQNRPRVITSSVPAQGGSTGVCFPSKAPLERVGGALERKTAGLWSGRFISIIGGLF